MLPYVIDESEKAIQNGDILSASGEVNSIFGEGTTVCTLNLKAGHTYLLIGYNSINISNENIVMSADIAAESGSFATWNLGLTSRTTGSNGGGAYCIVIASCNTDSSVKLVGYGYHDSTYKHRGGLTAVQLR